MNLHPAQAQILSDNHRFRIVNCGRRFGKTTLAVEEIKCLALSKNARIVYIAPTIQQARDIAWSMMLAEMKPIIVKAVESPSREITVKNTVGGTSLIQLRGWEAIETLRGQYFDFIVIDEVASMRNFWLHWQEVIRPTLTDRKGQVLFISTPKGFNHFYDLFNTQDEDYKSFQFTSYDNPFIPSEEIDKAKQEIPEDRFAQEYLADFRKTEGLVYKEFDRNRHVTDQEPNSVIETLAGIDWGHTNPASTHRYRKDSDRHYWIDREFYKTKQTTEQIIQSIDYQPIKVYPDPAESDRVDQAIKAGLNCRSVSKDIEAGIDTVKELFKQNRIHIHPSCKNLIQELETYHYPDKKPGLNEKELPVKENDHAMDEMRYVLHMEEMHYSEPLPKDPIFEQFGTHFIDS